ncbi:tyrosine-type recombinase/integrase [Pantoea sp. LMR881]|uniref:tyrosine-type recombinase/integrase n=1 Tax=Pantoea sp. LMR881 TaxID=3014336 RepID=UPI0022B06F8B|nr:tyrosine-type recombinase/integrase [Pantoea sp. LMR881]MCZ4061480.1 tyrosine-type recombinase/integrase [Pantoea sp. LMR881]
MGAKNSRSFLPMTSDDLRDYLTFLQASGRASSTISTHASLISMLHRNAGIQPPNTSPLVFRTLKKINRTAVVAGERTGQAVPFRLADLMKLDALWSVSTRKQDVRNLAFLHVAYSTLLRVSELARLRVRDISRAEDGRIILDVAWTKTIVQTGGLIKALSALSSRRLTKWIAAAGWRVNLMLSFFVRFIVQTRIVNTERPMSTPALEEIFAQARRAAGPVKPVKTNKNRYRGWSGHSARVGAAQDMAKKGIRWRKSCRKAPKKPETLMRYIRNVDAHKGAMVDLMEQQQSDTP